MTTIARPPLHSAQYPSPFSLPNRSSKVSAINSFDNIDVHAFHFDTRVSRHIRIGAFLFGIQRHMTFSFIGVK